MPTYPTQLQQQCPVIKQAEQVLEHSKNLRAAMNKLRRDLSTCQDCPIAGQCTVLVKLNQEIDAAIDALALEWGLT
jgi:hypothetical protein